jgi:exodeoxyribonuclease VII small subunit
MDTASPVSKLQPTANNADSSLPQSWNYEATVKIVEAIVAQIEAGELELAEVFDQFSAAIAYLNQCESFLHERQQQMDLLIETLTDESEF